MEENLAYQRKSYEKSALREENLSDHPMWLFKKWFEEVERKDPQSENNAMTVSTIDQNGFPHNRIVLLKKFNDEGFIFYTNYTSSKSKAILENSKVALSFFWPSVERQVIVRGEAIKVSEEESDEYFKTRPRGSQIGAWVSHQSSPVESRAELEKRQQELEEEFQNQEIKRPDFWGGFLIRPLYIEFWQGRPNRLHDRFLFTKTDENWEATRLAP